MEAKINLLVEKLNEGNRVTELLKQNVGNFMNEVLEKSRQNSLLIEAKSNARIRDIENEYNARIREIENELKNTKQEYNRLAENYSTVKELVENILVDLPGDYDVSEDILAQFPGGFLPVQFRPDIRKSTPSKSRVFKRAAPREIKDINVPIDILPTISTTTAIPPPLPRTSYVPPPPPEWYKGSIADIPVIESQLIPSKRPSVKQRRSVRF